MRLPDTAHTSRPWRIHELAGDFRLEDVWALPTPGGPDDFPRLVQWWASRGDPSRASPSCAVRMLWAIRWNLDDAVTAAEWAAENTARLGAGTGQLLVGGAGPGGALAAAVALHARVGGWPTFSRQVLVCASPVEPMPPSLAGVAPATAVTIEHDPGGDEGRYAALLRRAGVAVDELRYAAPDCASAVRIRTGRQLLSDLGEALSNHPGDDLP